MGEKVRYVGEKAGVCVGDRLGCVGEEAAVCGSEGEVWERSWGVWEREAGVCGRRMWKPAMAYVTTSQGHIRQDMW